MAWTDERVEILKKLWSEGLSASQIAGRLGGVTRNAVIGKVHRLGLSGRATTTRSRGATRTRTRAVAPRRARTRFPLANHPLKGLWQWDQSQRPDAATETVEELVIPLDERLSILTLKDSSCRWPIGDPQLADFHFCGRQKHASFPYCEFHARKAFQPPQAQRRKDRDEQHGLLTLVPVKVPLSA